MMMMTMIRVTIMEMVNLRDLVAVGGLEAKVLTYYDDDKEENDTDDQNDKDDNNDNNIDIVYAG